MHFLFAGIRFLRQNLTLSICVSSVIALGMGISTLVLIILLALSNPRPNGTRAGNYLTVAGWTEGGPLRPISWETMQRVRRIEPQALQGAYAQPISVLIEGNNRSFAGRLAAVTGDFFTRFTPGMLAGADMSKAQETPSALHVIVLSFHLAGELFGSPTQTLDRYVTVRGVSLRVVGVAASAFHGVFGEDVDAWVPSNCSDPIYASLSGMSQHPATDLGAQKRGELWKKLPIFYALLNAERPNLNSAAAELNRRFRSEADLGTRIAAFPGFTADPSRNSRLRHWARLAFFIALSLTLASGLNFGGLFLAKASRQVETVRLKRVLGAGRFRLVTEVSSGPILLVVIGFSGALLLSVIVAFALARRVPDLNQLAVLSWRSAFFVFAVQFLFALGVAGSMGVLPAMRIVREGGAPKSSYTASLAKHTILALKIIASVQIACCILSCITAALVGRFAKQVLDQPLGFRPNQNVVLAVGVRAGHHAAFSMESQGNFPLATAGSNILRRLSAFPGIEHVALTLSAPMDSSPRSLTLRTSGDAAYSQTTVSYNGVSRQYLETLGTRLVAGRMFATERMTGEPTEALIDEALGKQLWPAQSALGKTIQLDNEANGASYRVTIVGVVENQRLSGPMAAGSPTVLLPLQGTVFAAGVPIYVLIHGQYSKDELTAAVNEEFSAAVSGFEVVYGYRISDRLAKIAEEEIRRLGFAVSGAAATLLVACIGLYGLLAYLIRARQKEIAIRICCGASPQAIGRLVLMNALAVNAVALFTSTVCCLFLCHLVSEESIGVTWSWNVALAVSGVCFAGMAMVSCFPAMGASVVSPAQGLRAE